MTPVNELKRLLETARDVRVSLAICDLASGAQLLVKPDEAFHPASTFKIGVMMEVFHQAEYGLFALDDRLPVKNSFTSIADGSDFSLSPQDDAETGLYGRIGHQRSVRDLTTRMIAWSSNLATNLLIEKLGVQYDPHFTEELEKLGMLARRDLMARKNDLESLPAADLPVGQIGAERATRFMRTLGTKDLIIRRGPEDNKAYALGLNNSATARSLMQVLVCLAKRTVVSPAASDEMIAMLKQQHFNEGLPAQLPAGVSVAHKTGWNEKLYHDAGIVYPPGHTPYVVVIMTAGLPEQTEAPALVAALSREIYRQLVGQGKS